MKYLKKFSTTSKYETYITGTPFLPNVSLITETGGGVYYNPDPYNGHEYVDLGLPSGLKWATCNVGATSPEGYGLFFQWGDTQGYADASTKDFSWSTYKYGTSSSSLTKYNSTDGLTTLELSDDAARANMGGSWRMPTQTEFQELYDNCTTEWTTVNSINGRLFTSKNNSKTIFFPASGVCDGSSLYGRGSGGGYWSSALHSSETYASGLGFNSSGVNPAYVDYRCSGVSVRGIVDA